MIKVFTAKNEHRNKVISLWNKCFGDSEDYISFFIDNCPEYVCVGFFSDNDLVSMLFLLNGTLLNKKCHYLYAACTDSGYRKQGIMEQLITFSKLFCKSQGSSGIFLVPANEELYDFYSKFGFISSFTKNKISISCGKEDCIDYSCKNIDVITDLKCELLSGLNCFSFERPTIKYTVKEHFFNGGEALVYKGSEGNLVAFFYIDNDSIIVKELLSDFDLSTDFIKNLFLNKYTENIYIFTPIVYNTKDIGEEYTKCGMCFPLDEELADYLHTETRLYAGMYLD